MYRLATNRTEKKRIEENEEKFFRQTLRRALVVGYYVLIFTDFVNYLSLSMVTLNRLTASVRLREHVKKSDLFFSGHA